MPAAAQAPRSRPREPSVLPAGAPPRRVLIIRPTALGDVSRTVPALVSLRAALPEARIDWLVHDAFADVIRHHPALSHVVAFPRVRFGRIGRSPAATLEALRWARELRRTRYDLVFDLQGLSRSGLLTWLTDAPRRVGDAGARELAWLGYNRRHRVDPSAHAVDRMLALVEAEGFAPVRDLRLYVGLEDQHWLDELLAGRGVGEEGYFVVAPTARWRSKCWPIDRYAEVTRRLLATRAAGSHAVVLASPAERAQVEPVVAAAADRSRVIVPETTVGQMMALLSRARLLICNDSAPLHVAVGLGRPIVAIFGPTDPALVGPYRRADAVVRPAGAGSLSLSTYRRQRDDQSLIAQVSVDAVWRRVEEELARV